MNVIPPLGVPSLCLWEKKEKRDRKHTSGPVSRGRGLNFGVVILFSFSLDIWGCIIYVSSESGGAEQRQWISLRLDATVAATTTVGRDVMWGAICI